MYRFEYIGITMNAVCGYIFFDKQEERPIFHYLLITNKIQKSMPV
jgi:hypothetical protein